MSARTAPLHSPAELAFVAADETTGIVTFAAPSKSHPATPNTTSLDTLTGATFCDCRAAECGKECWHVALVAAAWYRTPAMLDTLWLTDRELSAYGKKLGAMCRIYRARTGRVLPMDAINLVAARAEYRRRQAAVRPAVSVAADELPLAA
jgi:hypothetical protein